MRKLEGQKFGRLTVLHDIGSDGHYRLWECLCDCGQFVIVNTGLLTTGRTKSCGCLRSETSRKSVKNIAGHNKLPIGEANLTRVFWNYKYNAKKRNLEFLLTKKQFKELTQQNCFYCGAKPYNAENRSTLNGKFIYNGIDRVDNTKGYIIDNCVTCCRICNDWKRAYTQQEFLMRIKLIYENLLRKQNG